MDGVVIGALILLSLLVGFTFWHVLTLRTEFRQFVPAIGSAFAKLDEGIQEMVNLPEALKGMGGVQLMPQKSFGEVIMEHVSRTFFGDQPLSNDQPEGASWPPEESEPLAVEGSSRDSD